MNFNWKDQMIFYFIKSERPDAAADAALLMLMLMMMMLFHIYSEKEPGFGRRDIYY